MLDPIEVYQHHDCFLADHLVGMLQELAYHVGNCLDHHRVVELGQDRQRCQDLEVVLGLQIFLDGCDHKNNHLTVWVDKEGTGEIPDSLDKQILGLREIDGVDVTE